MRLGSSNILHEEAPSCKDPLARIGFLKGRPEGPFTQCLAPDRGDGAVPRLPPHTHTAHCGPQMAGGLCKAQGTLSKCPPLTTILQTKSASITNFIVAFCRNHVANHRISFVNPGLKMWQDTKFCDGIATGLGSLCN